MRTVELIIRQHPEDTFPFNNHDEQLAKLFRAVKWAGELWLDPQKIPPMPDWCQYYSDPLDVAERLVVKDDYVEYTTMSGKGVYRFWPDGFIFEGAWRSLLDGCPLCHIVLVGPPDQPYVTPKNAKRADIYIFAPIGPIGLQVFYGGFYYVELSEEWVKDIAI